MWLHCFQAGSIRQQRPLAARCSSCMLPCTPRDPRVSNPPPAAPALHPIPSFQHPSPFAPTPGPAPGCGAQDFPELAEGEVPLQRNEGKWEFTLGESEDG